MIKLKIILSSVLLCCGLKAASPVIFAIAGINGRGSEAEYVRELLGDESPQIISIENPERFPDLGQSRCIKQLHTVFCDNAANDPVIIHATSQGAATALNYFAQVDKGRCIKALILEAPLASGNSAISHTLNGPLMNKPGLVKAPLSYYWLPYVAKALFPLYSPSGKQPIKSIELLPDFDTPIIIIHSKDDAQLCFDDSCALYYGLRLKNKNVYLVTKEGRCHINVVKNECDKAVIRAILSKHGLLKYTNFVQHGFASNDPENLDLDLYQPDPSAFKQKYEELLLKERKHTYLGYGLLVACCALLVKPTRMLYKLLCSNTSD